MELLGVSKLLISAISEMAEDSLLEMAKLFLGKLRPYRK